MKRHGQELQLFGPLIMSPYQMIWQFLWYISSLVPWFECVRHLTRNSIICRFFMDLNWITSSSLLNVISTIASVWESLAFGHNDLNWIDSISLVPDFQYGCVSQPYWPGIVNMSIIDMTLISASVCVSHWINWIEWNSFQFLSASVQAWGRWHISVISSEGARRTFGG